MGVRNMIQMFLQLAAELHDRISSKCFKSGDVTALPSFLLCIIQHECVVSSASCVPTCAHDQKWRRIKPVFGSRLAQN